MRKFAKISAVLAAMVLALAFVGCKSDDDDDDDPSVVTEWSCVNSDEQMTLYFYDDSSFKVELSGDVVASGAYSGDTTAITAVINLTFTKIINEETGKLEDCSIKTTATPVSGYLALNLSDLDMGVLQFTKK